MNIYHNLCLALGMLIGGGIVYTFYRLKQQSWDIAEDARKEAHEEMKNTFKSLSSDVLRDNNKTFLQLADTAFAAQREAGGKTLDEKKTLIDANLKTITDSLGHFRKETLTLTNHLSTSQEETTKLQKTTQELRNILSSSQARGQWGEKMVVDILRLVGMIENVNFVQQTQMEGGVTPDFTFFLPKKKKVNLDSKFPLAHYEQYIAADDQNVQDSEKQQFLNDVKRHLKAVDQRSYINQAAGTVDYVLVFIPNESIYAFIHQSDSGILEYALKKHIILCSPITLFAVLQLIHQAISNFAMEERAGQIMGLVAEFEKQWDNFSEQMEKMGRRIADAQKEYDTLTTTRTKALERPIRKIEDIRSSQEDGEDVRPD